MPRPIRAATTSSGSTPDCSAPAAGRSRRSRPSSGPRKKLRHDRFQGLPSEREVSAQPNGPARVSNTVLRPRLLALAVAAAFAALAPAAEARVPKDFVGVTAEDVFAGGQAYRDSNLSTQRALGVGIIRQTFDWSEIETKRGRYALGAYDDYVADLAKHGIKVLPLLY